MNTTAELINAPVEQRPCTVSVGTLLRYEWQRTRKIALGVPGAALLVAGLSALGVRLGDALTAGPMIGPLGAMSFVGFILGILAPAVATPLALAIEYWRNAYGRTGYLTQTIPARGVTQYFVRLGYGSVVVLLTLVAQVLIARISIALLPAHVQTDLWEQGFQPVLQELADLGALQLMVPLFAAQMVMGLVQLYFAASYGSESLLGRFGAGGPILAGLGLYLVNQVITFVALFAVPVVIVAELEGGRIQLHLEGVNLFTALLNEDSPGGVPLGIFLWGAALTVILIARTAYSWEKRISLR